MDKRVILKTLVEQLEQTRSSLIHSAKEAKDAATNEESKAENKYDTRGLEASYLAGAAAKRAADLVEVIQQLSKLEPREFKEGESAQVTALVSVEINGEEIKHFFILPFAGGSQVQVSGEEVFVITPNSPIAKLMLGKKSQDYFEFRTQSKISEYEITSIR